MQLRHESQAVRYGAQRQVSDRREVTTASYSHIAPLRRAYR